MYHVIKRFYSTFRRSRVNSIAAIPENVSHASNPAICDLKEEIEMPLVSNQTPATVSPSSAPLPLTVTESTDFKFIKSKKVSNKYQVFKYIDDCYDTIFLLYTMLDKLFFFKAFSPFKKKTYSLLWQLHS